MTKRKLLILSFFLYLLNISLLFSNEIVNIKTYNRDDYIRLMFELTEKPNYFVNNESNKIEIFLANTTLKTTPNIDKYTIIDNMKFIKEKENIRCLLELKNNANLKRYLYTAPSNLTKYYRFIVDINKEKIESDELESIVLDIIKNKTEEKIDDFIVQYTGEEKTVNDVILENIKPENIAELLDLNNISDEEVTKDIENQNNDEINIDEFLKKISVKIESELDKKEDVKIYNKNYEKTPIKKQYVVVLDAGHGGKDPGAIGLFRTKEKNVNLNVAKAIKNELNKNSKLKVYLTRNDDRFIELYDRVNKSRKLKADLFISIHSDSTRNRKARGLSIYTLKKSASDVRTTRLYGKNNILQNESFQDLKYDTISAILDISRYENLNKSIKFSEQLIKNFKKQDINLLYNPHKYGNFAVLLAPEYPSVLIELGFISNPYDEKMLNSRDFRKKISISVAKAVSEYFGL